MTSQITSVRADLHVTGAIAYQGWRDVKIPTRLLDLVRLEGYNVFSVVDADPMSPQQPLLGVIGREIGHPSFGVTVVTVFGYFEPGERTLVFTPVPVKLDPSAFDHAKYIGDDPRDLIPNVRVNGSALTFDPADIELVDATAAKQVFKFTGSGWVAENETTVNSEVWVTIGNRAPYFEFEGYVVASDPDRPLEYIDADVSVSFRENTRLEYSPDDAFAALGDDRLYAAGRVCFSGRVLAQPSKAAFTHDLGGGDLSDSADEVNWPPDMGDIFLRLTPFWWQGFALWYREAKGDASWPLPRPYSYELSGPRMRNSPRDTGDALAFCEFPVEVFHMPVAKLANLQYGVFEEALRQTSHWRDGVRVKASEVPGVSTHNSVPDSRFGSNLLSFNYGGWPQEGKLKVHDEAHMAHGYTVATILLCERGGYIAEAVLEDQCELLYASQLHRPGQARAIGRVLDTLAFGYAVLGGYHRRKCLEAAAAKTTTLRAVLSNLEVGSDARSFPGLIDRHPNGYARELSDFTAAWSPFQNSLAVKGFNKWMSMQLATASTFFEDQLLPGHRDVIEMVDAMAGTIVREAYYDQGDFYVMLYSLGWDGSGIPIDPDDYVHGQNVTFAASTGAFLVTCAPTTDRVMRSGLSDAATTTKAIEILDRLTPTTWDVAKWVGLY